MFVMRAILAATGISTILVTVMFLGGEPASARGFYYVVWLSIVWGMWKHRRRISGYVQQSPFGEFITYLGLVIAMILLEETLAGISVNILNSSSLQTLTSYVVQYYANNVFLLPGFTLAWFFLLRRYRYSQMEVFTLIGLFGIFAEKVYLHVLTMPILGVVMILPTVFTYIGIILPAYLSLRTRGACEVSRTKRYVLGCLLPIICSLPLLLIHQVLSQLGIIDPTVLTR